MRNYLNLFVICGLIMLGCTAKENNSKSNGIISGTYFREYSFKVTKPETGDEIGLRIIRDTIFIRSLSSEFEVSNHKWKRNDYDNEGWQNMNHDDNRPVHSFKTTLDPTKNTLTSEQDVSLHWHVEKSAVSWDGLTYYHKVSD